MSKFTRGPWESEHRKGADGMYRTEIFSEQHGGIATCDWTPMHCGNGVTKTYREANARLIAAAPELYEALEMAKEHIVSTSQAMGWNGKSKAELAIDAVLKKARGR